MNISLFGLFILSLRAGDQAVSVGGGSHDAARQHQHSVQLHRVPAGAEQGGRRVVLRPLLALPQPLLALPPRRQGTLRLVSGMMEASNPSFVFRFNYPNGLPYMTSAVGGGVLKKQTKRTKSVDL